MGNGCSDGVSTNEDMTMINKLQKHDAKIFMICCMDFRFVNDHKSAMLDLGHKIDYDQYVIAGGSLGFICGDYEHWGKAA